MESGILVNIGLGNGFLSARRSPEPKLTLCNFDYKLMSTNCSISDISIFGGK